jgi:tight adherence protein B
MSLLAAAFVFICVLGAIEGLFIVAHARLDPTAKKVARQLKAAAAERFGEGGPGRSVVTPRAFSYVPRLNLILGRIALMQRLDRLLLQAGAARPLGFFVLLALILAVSGFYAAVLCTGSALAGAPAGAVAGALPFAGLLMQKRQRMKKFEAQLPEALDLMARSLRAGHAFVGGLQMAAQEFDDPMGAEMQKAVAQISLGVSVEQALKNLTARVDCQDLKFLAVSIIIQRESGGNLTEILETIAALIRERFKLHGKVRALSAEGKLSAVILTALPFVITFMLAVINPAYPRSLWEDPMGRMLAVAAIIMMAAGVAVMKKMTGIRV